jgi:Protein of unknown function (DUF3224)
MTQRATGTIETTKWDEQPLATMGDERSRRVVHGSMAEVFRGDIEAEASNESLLAYTNESTASFVGFEQVRGRLNQREGAFVLRITGQMTNGTGIAQWQVVDGSGTDGLKGVSGSGGYEWDGKTVRYTLNYDL